MKRIKETYLLFIIVVGLFSLSIYSTYALFTEEYIVGGVNITSNTFNIKISDLAEYKRIDSYIGENRNIVFNLLNASNDSKYYGLYTDLDKDCIQLIHDNDKAEIRGIISNNGSKTVSISVNNTCSYNYSFNVYIITSLDDLSNKDVIDDKRIIKDSSVKENMDNKLEDESDNKEIDSDDIFNNNDITYLNNYILSLYKNDSLELLLDDDNNLRYYGSNPDNFISFNDELWRIIGVFKIDDNYLIKIINNSSLDNYKYSDYNNSWKNSNIMKMLNPNYSESKLYWEKLSEISKEYLIQINYRLGEINSASNTAKDLYGDENIKNAITWKGYLGLMYPSDYAYSKGNSCNDINLECDSYLNSENKEFTISPIKGENNKLFAILKNGLTVNNDDYLSFRPVGYLNDQLLIDGGTGTKDDPYKVSLK